MPAIGRLATSGHGLVQAEPPTFVIEARGNLLRLDLGSIWQRRELRYFLVWRDVKVRYKQTAIEAAWIPSADLPYIVLAFAGFLPWTYFSQTLTRSSLSLVGNATSSSRARFSAASGRWRRGGQ